MTRSWWTSSTAHVVEEVVPADPDVVRDFYADLDNIRELHPLVVSVRSVDRRDVADGHERTYRVRDRIPFGPLTVPISYSARVLIHRDGDVHTQARQFPAVRLDGTVSFVAEGGGTRVTERLTVHAPRPLAGTTARRAVAAHAEMFAGIRRHFA
ncbi:SRPBCC family protein [Mycolicibacterium sediminis]|uniref:Polyketide cyclase n=1 Tax=Mycolicibacterium sediminis TaxID=1286180 RepID=A0A7I7QVM5_9MYCO|nr:SRPBCC family protein [Mycolicibacterium sediminis]BBY30047.1 hypothetical protein MSEDJ_41430 [Mycolicibacterium sediminis]